MTSGSRLAIRIRRTEGGGMPVVSAQFSALAAWSRDRGVQALPALFVVSALLAAPTLLDAQHGVAIALVTFLLVASRLEGALPLVVASSAGPPHRPAASRSRPLARTGLVTDIPRSPVCPRAPGGR